MSCESLQHFNKDGFPLVPAELHRRAGPASHETLLHHSVVLQQCMGPFFGRAPHKHLGPCRCVPAGQLFGQLVDLLAFYTAFPIDNNTAQALSEQDVQQRHYDRVLDPCSPQQMCQSCCRCV